MWNSNQSNLKDNFSYYSQFLLSISFVILFFNQASSQNFPPGFSQVSVASGLANPTVMAFAPDGRIFVAEQAGSLRIIKQNTLLTQPALQLEVNAWGERGLIGIALDPDFTTNGYIYLYYTVASGAFNRISRFTASGDTLAKASEKVLLNLDSLSTATNHNGGAMHFGKDGKLYVAVGENARPELAQELDSYLGKLLRINPDGSAPSDNPFPSGSAQKRRIWAYGLRNPFTFSVHPVSGNIFINDVGQVGWEEINDATEKGHNFAWPRKEGRSADPDYDNPIYFYRRVTRLEDGVGCAITGGTFFDPASSNYPSQYKGKYFFQDYCNGWINYLDLSEGVTKKPFATGFSHSSLSLSTGRDGNLYYLSRTNNALYKILYTKPDTAPKIEAQPTDIAAYMGDNIRFTVNVTGADLQYQWQKNRVNIEGATSAMLSLNKVQLTDIGRYRVIIQNTFGSVTSRESALVVHAFNNPPVASILTPTEGSVYTAGQTIYFEGNATDKEDKELPESAFSWEVVFHHDTHSHDGPPIATGVKSGSFTIPNSGETSPDVWYRLYLTVTDAKGLSHKVYRDIYPRTSTLVLATQPAGLELTLDGQPVTAPTSVVGVEGLLRSIGTAPRQKIGAAEYVFDRWLHGGNRNQTINFPDTTTTYRAIFKIVLRDPDSPDEVVNGVNYRYYEGRWNQLPDFDTLKPIKRGAVSNINLALADTANYFGFEFTGYVQVPEDGEYTFYTTSDDGSQFYIGNSLVVDNDGLHGPVRRFGKIGLKAGKHAFTLNYFDRIGDETLRLWYKGPGIDTQLIPDSALFRLRTHDININFQPAASTVPSGYLPDTGEVFTAHDNGFSYGWNQPTFYTRDRGPRANLDSRYATFNHMQKVPQADAIWEIALNNGFYQVKVVCSDPLHTDQLNHLLIENTLVSDEDGYDYLDEYQLTVQVTDGRLTIKPAPGAVNAKLSFVDITQISAAARVANSDKQSFEPIEVFPNPASDQLSVRLMKSQSGQVKLTVTDVLSRVVFTQLYHLEQGEHLLSLPVKDLKAGSYLLQLSSDSQSFSHRISIIR